MYIIWLLSTLFLKWLANCLTITRLVNQIRTTKFQYHVTDVSYPEYSYLKIVFILVMDLHINVMAPVPLYSTDGMIL